MSLSVLRSFPWGWFLVSVPCGWRESLIWFQFSWICWGFFCVLSCGLSLKIFYVHLKRMCILHLFVMKGSLSLYIYISVKSIWSRALFIAAISLLIFCLEDLSIFWQWGVKIPYYNCVAVNIFLEILQDFPYVFVCSYVGFIYIHNVYVFLMDSSLEYYEVTFWISFYGPSFEIYFVWYEYWYPGFIFLSICSEYLFLALHFQSV